MFIVCSSFGVISLVYNINKYKYKIINNTIHITPNE